MWRAWQSQKGMTKTVDDHMPMCLPVQARVVEAGGWPRGLSLLVIVGRDCGQT